MVSPCLGSSCPSVEGIVRSAVEAALQQDIAIAAGLLRIFFHDCFPQGCDASLLLTGSGSEQQLAPNLTLQPRALQLIEEIRGKVHAACGPTVSCADITALATRDAVYASGGPSYAVPLGRLDSLAPAPSSAVFQLPQATSDASTLIGAFKSRNLSETDLVALSGGGHTIGRAHCTSFSNRFNTDTSWDNNSSSSSSSSSSFVRKLAANCSSSSPNRLQELDVTTPDVFDNKYFLNLQNGQGVLTSDQVLAGDWRTGWIVNGYAGNHWWFYDQFRQSMIKLGNLKNTQQQQGEIRRSCYKPNNAPLQSTQTKLLELIHPAAGYQQ
ncbi:hypothetical protein PR202_ga18492 [Eleusine coracana subsp. coracana]|uniref:Peroxidase n=1 Tax=Eleusine coracana subsp. coracana TaxID=191504 RepID=A0AAV5CSP7_ELECO|nr:hypothetical protein PR202_ga18492 [Eleusine coracana subsp. coracana]